MDPLTIGLIGGSALAGIGGSIMAGNAQRDAAKSAERTARAAQQLLLDTPMATIEEQELVLGQLAQIGELTPEMLQALELGPSEMEGVSTDPRLAATQMQALEQLAGLSEGGLSEADIAALEQTRRSVEGSQEARQEAILQDMQQRGIGGAGAELAMRLAATQGAADRQNQASLDVTRQAQARALQALAQQANLAGQVRSQEFGEQSDIARAQDAIREFNLRNQQRVQDSNVAARNQAQAANLSTAQEIANRNVGLMNQQQQFNKGLIQQQFQNEMQRRGGAANMAQGISQAQMNQGAADAAMYSGIAGGLAQAGMAGAGMMHQGMMVDKKLAAANPHAGQSYMGPLQGPRRP